MGHIFISYSRKDEEYVNKLVDALENEGFDVWIDREMLTGAEWIRVINHKIDTCDAFVIVLTKDSKESKWVNRELLYALQEEKRIFPLLRQGRLWMQLQDLNYFDVRNGSIPNKKFFNDVSKIIPRSERWLKAQQEKENQSAIREQAETERKRKIAREKAEKEAVEIYRNEAAKRQKDAEREEKRNLFLSTVGSRFSTFNVYFRKIFIPAFLLIAVLIGMVYYGKSVYDDFMLRATPLISQVPTSQTSLIVTETNIVAIPSETLSVTFTPDITSTPTSLPTEITDAKGIPMILIPDGKFTMGRDRKSVV